MPFSPQVVFRGNPNSRILVIGIAPGQEEIDGGLPFIGPSGKLTESLLQSILPKLPPKLRAPNFTTLNEVQDHYVFTNAVFGKPKEKRPPHAFELAGYLPYLKRMIFAMKPRLIICLGNVPTSVITSGCSMSAFQNVRSSHVFTENDPPITNFTKIAGIEGRYQTVNIYSKGEVFSTYMVPMNHPAGFLYNKAKDTSKWAETLQKAYTTLFGESATIADFPEPRTTPFHVAEIGKPEGGDSPKGFEPDSDRYVKSVSQMVDKIETSEMFKCLFRQQPGPPSRHTEEFSQRHFCGMLRNLEYDRSTSNLLAYLTTPDGKSALIRMKGFRYEFHVVPHPGISEGNHGAYLDRQYLDSVEKTLRSGLMRKHKNESTNTPRKFIFPAPDIVCSFSNNKRIMERYEHLPPTTICISVPHHDMVADLTEVIYNACKWYDHHNNVTTPKPRIMNNMFSAPHSFNHKTGIAMSTWMKFAPNSITFTKPRHKYGLQYAGYCDISNDIIEGLDFAKPVPVDEVHYPGTLSDDHAPLTRLSFDIECANPDNKFPNPIKDPITTICNIIHFKNGKCKYNTKNHTLLRKDMETYYNDATAEFLKKKIEVIENLLKKPMNDDKKRALNKDLVNARRDFFRNIAEGYYEVYFTLGLIDNTIVNENERKLILEFQKLDVMLKCWTIFVRSLGPNYICGHNVKNFDLNYIINSMRTLNLPVDEAGFNDNAFLAVNRRRFESRAFGERIITEIQGLNGAVVLDTLEMYFREKKLRSYTLEFLAETFLGEKKDDMPYSAIWGYWVGTEEDRRVLTDYCARDSRIVDQLINHGNWDSGLCEFARLNGAVSEGNLYTEGQQIVVLSSIMKQSFKENNRILVLASRSRQTDSNIFIDKFSDFWKNKDCEDDENEKSAELEDVDLTESIQILESMMGNISVTSRKRPHPSTVKEGNKKKQKVETKAKYKGATVLTPKTGCHIVPILTFDFAALYPSIMRRYNICMTTIIYESYFAELEGQVTREMCNKSPVKGTNPATGEEENVYFIKHQYYEGIFRTTEAALKAARDACKALQATYAPRIESPPGSGTWVPNPNADPIKYAICSVREQKIKIIMNSIYGATGAEGTLKSKDCAAAVTAWGREAIEFVKLFLETEYGATCYGGDTDSVFVSIPGVDSVAKAEACADEIAAAINKHFEEPMKIDYEKCYYPMILIAPKRYMGLKYTRGSGVTVESKGIETVRRDSLGYVSNLMKGVFANILQPRKADEGFDEYALRVHSLIDKEVARIREAGTKLLKEDVPTHMLVMSKQYSKHDYKALTQPHLFVRKKMIERGLKAPELGERIPFLYVVRPNDPTTGKERKGCELAEHPDYAIQRNMKINYKLYFEKKFMKPIMSVMKHFLKDKAAKAIIAKNTVHKFEKVDGEFKMVTGLRSGFNGIEKKLLENEIMEILFSPKAGSYLGVVQSNTVKSDSEYSQITKYITSQTAPDTSKLSSAQKADLIRSYRLKVKEATSKRNACLKTCQDCTKTTNVICGATDCESYFPRIESAQRLIDIESIYQTLRK
jgi:uracil-DNA glycosylase family 4